MDDAEDDNSIGFWPVDGYVRQTGNDEFARVEHPADTRHQRELVERLKRCHDTFVYPEGDRGTGIASDCGCYVEEVCRGVWREPDQSRSRA